MKYWICIKTLNSFNFLGFKIIFRFINLLRAYSQAMLERRLSFVDILWLICVGDCIQLELKADISHRVKGHFLLGRIFHAEQNFLLSKDQLVESGCQETKEIIVPNGKFRLVENGPKN